MTLRNLPPEGASLDFSADIIAGRRPDFLPEVVKAHVNKLVTPFCFDFRMLIIHFL